MHKVAGAHEWVGGRVTAPFYVTEPEPYRPEMILWLELPEDLIVASTLLDPEGPPVSFGDTLLDAMASPLAGPPRRPARLRVADARLAAEVREAVPDVEVVVAPTPELDRILQLMAESAPPEDEIDLSYFEGGGIPTQTIASLFGAAQLLFRVAPWKVADDSQLLRLDIPAFGVEGACLSIIGALGESLGFIVFPSLVAYEQFLDAAEAGFDLDGAVDLGTSTLSLNFERGADLPASMHREAAKHGWPVADATAYPWVQHRDRDGVLRPLTARDVQIVSACAVSLSTFFSKHGRIFEHEAFEPVCESFTDENDLEVRFTAPYEAAAQFPVNDPLASEPSHPSPPKVGRNAPCPCGSGKKYKKCCMGKDRAARESAQAPAALHDIDRRLVGEMMRFAAQRFGDAWSRAAEDFDDPETAIQLFEPWAVYQFAVEGKPVVVWFVEARKRRLSNSELKWLQAQQASWLSVWEVIGVEPGKGMVLADLLTDEQRTVEEVGASQTLVRRDAILGRIVDYDGLSVLCGVHPRPLPPGDVAEVVRRIRGRLRRKRAIPLVRLRDDKTGRYLIARWEDAVEEADVRCSDPPRLQNTDGEELLLTVDLFAFEPALCDEVEKCLAALEGVEPPERGAPDQGYVFMRPGNAMHGSWENTVVGRAEVSAGKLRLETNSVARADSLRERIETACGDLIRHRAREHSDPTFQLRQGGKPTDRGGAPVDIPPADANRLVREFKDKHYADWADQPIPTLQGRTPRQAVQTKAGRDQVDLLLKDCENHEARMPEEQQYDFSRLRSELGLDA